MVSQILIVMIAAIAVTIWAERRNIQAPLLLALVGLAASYIPMLPRLELEPEIILTVVLPPLLYSAATQFSFVSFIRRLGSIVNLGVFLILVTTFVVGGIAAIVIPGVSLATASVLAAVVSPPDAVTAAAVGRKLNLPGRLMTVLKGESLINDAAALTLFAFAVASASGRRLFIDNGLLYFAYAAIAGIVVGVVIGTLVHRTRVRLSNASLVTVLSVLVPFTAYLIAEELGASGVLAVVAAGFSLGHQSTESHYASRLQERQFWRTADALLEAFVFAYIGLQMRWVIEDSVATGISLGQLILFSTLVLVAVILVRIGWVFATALISHWRLRRTREMMARVGAGEEAKPLGKKASFFDRRREMQRRASFDLQEPFSWRENLVIAWTGMRGVVTLAAASGIPLTTHSGSAFPGRDIIQFVAFFVTIGTLLLQGLTLPWLIKVLGISDPAEDSYRASQHRLAEEIADAAGKQALQQFRDAQTDPAARATAERMVERANFPKVAPTPGSAGQQALMLELGRAVLESRRAALVAARDDHKLDDEVLREVMEEIDLQQAVLANWEPGRFGA